MNAHQAQTDAQAAHGLRPSNAPACPRTVAGRRCVNRYPTGPLQACVCDRHHCMLDHARMWLDADGNHVLTCEPYQATGADMAAFLADVHALGLRATLAGQSPWNPGGTFSITVRKATPAREQTGNTRAET